MRRVIGVVLGTAVLSAGATVGLPHRVGAEPPRPSGIGWTACAEPAGERRERGEAPVECGTVEVPLDHAAPGGSRITLAVNRVRGSARRDGTHLGALLVNPGGPGASGQELAKFVAATLPAEVAARFDVIGFDPRGVGASKPALSCVDPERHYAAPRPDNVPRGAAEEAALVARARDFAAACGEKAGRLLPYLDSAATVHDMDAIRAALGEEKISYFGYSYGTYLGAAYATAYPRRIFRLVLDSVVDPAGVWYHTNLTQNLAFDRRHKRFLSWVAKHHDVYRLGKDPKQVEFAWYAMRGRLRAKPAGVLGPSELDDVYTVAGYTDAVWPKLAAAFSAYALRGETEKLLAARREHAVIGAKEENSYAVYTSVECRDAAWPRDWGVWRADSRRIYARAPFLTWANTWYNAPCAFWPVPSGRPPAVGTGDLPPVLLLQAEQDAATPYPGALRVRRLFPTARLVAEGGGNHGVGLAGNTCVDRHLTRYLTEGVLPARRAGSAADARCAGRPDPSAALRMAAGHSAHLRLIRALRGG
ncbi:alpha/beta hydrolase [Rhizohabitans arisaemae]|uniref:alpha/beta hydrolase n=1 Tax=Rhizohabitans arisaemae TaxID=2720610 RepID=UPI0024B17B3B|nr:alpha/beta hydrolase [Rhizohabitans arisaemae]